MRAPAPGLPINDETIASIVARVIEAGCGTRSPEAGQVIWYGDFQSRTANVSELSCFRCGNVVLQLSTEYTSGMGTLAEIEAVVDALPAGEKQELLLFLAARLRAQSGRLPAPRKFSREQLNAWIAEDEADMQRFHDSQPK